MTRITATTTPAKYFLGNSVTVNLPVVPRLLYGYNKLHDIALSSGDLWLMFKSRKLFITRNLPVIQNVATMQ